MAAAVTETVVPGESAPAVAGSGTTGGAPRPRVPSTGDGPWPAVVPQRLPGRLRLLLGGGRWNTPSLVRALTALCLAALLLLAAVAATVLGGARDSIDAIGHRAAPQAVRASDLYFALSDMDAQAANLLLVGAAPEDLAKRSPVHDLYEQRRTQADTDLQQAAEGDGGDPAGHRAVATVLAQLGRYEALVARSDLLESQAKAQPGQPPADALQAYQQATGLLREQLLPAADQVAGSNEATVNRDYAGQRSDLAAGWWWLLATGLLALLALAGLQYLLTTRFRRLVNPPLAVATLLTAAGLVYALALASAADHQLVVAKSNAYDSVIALSRARAVAYDSNADESRYLSDPSRAADYEQSFFDKTQSIVRIDGALLGTYDSRLDGVVATHRENPADVRFGGYLGDELRNVTFPGEQEAADRVLTTFQAYQKDDAAIRGLNSVGRLTEAIAFDTGTAPGQSNADFDLLSTAFGDVIGINQRAFDHAVSQADGDLGPAAAAAAAALLLAALALTAAGVRPRLREYR